MAGRAVSGVAAEVVADVVGEVAGRVVAVLRPARQGFEQERLNLAIDRAVGGTRADGVIFGDVPENVEGGAADVVRVGPGEQVVEYDSQRVDVGSRVQFVGPAHCLFWGHVCRRARDSVVSSEGDIRGG